MAGGEPEVGDKVSWNWGGGAPGGTVAEKKHEGEISITSHRGNEIKKNADSDDPAVHVERSGNDVVKKASELNIEKKNAGGKKGGNKKDAGKKEEKKEDGEAESKTGDKRKHNKSESKDEGKNGEEPATVTNDDGKEVKPGGKDAKKKQKTETEPKKKQDEKKEEKKEEKKDDKKEEKKKPGRPRKEESEKKGKKDPTPREQGDLVSTRTRSQRK